MKPFTTADTQPHAGHLGMFIDYPNDLVDDPLWYHKQHLQQTASGYGAKLTSQYKVSYNGKLYRIYHTCYGNASSAWFVAKGQKVYVN
jgi:hypothetical protein